MAWRPEIVAHRGASGYAPENTLPAFRRAVELGVRTIELDLHLTADGVPIVIHDATVDRTTDGSGPVTGFTLAQLRELDAGAWFGAAFRGTPLPTLAEVITALPPTTRFLIELKGGGEALVTAVLAEVATVRDRVRLISFHEESLAVARAADATIALGALESRDGDRLATLVARYRCEAAMPSVRLVTPERVREWRRITSRIAVWTLNQPEQFQTAWDVGADEWITDYPDRARDWLVQEARRAE